MINLLPLEEKYKLFLEKKVKLYIIFGLVVLIFLICFILVLLSIKFYILSVSDYQKNILEQVKKEVQTPYAQNLNNNVTKYNKTLSQLSSFYNQEAYFSQILNNILQIPSPEGLYINNFSLIRVERGNVQAMVSGISNTRDNLLLFKKNIEEDKKFNKIIFSSESWVKPKNANFSLTFEASK